MFELFFVAVTIFVATNIDDFVTLGLLFSSNYRAYNIIFGQLLGIIALTFLSMIITFLSNKTGSGFNLSNQWTGLFGIMPIIIGFRTWGKKSENHVSLGQKIGWQQINAIVYLKISGGGDNISIYTPFFLPLSWWQIVEVMVIFVVMTGVWCLLVYSLSKYFRFDRFANKVSVILPCLFICFGVYILWNNDTVPWLYKFLG